MFTNTKRNDIISNLKNNKFDLLVIGGGITGAGIALDATTRGLSTAVLEMQDFAAGTSSRSTKLVHGGLRYLKQLDVKVVAEVGKERAIVYENGPHVTTPEWMLLPFHKGGTFGSFTTSIGLRVYDFLAGVKKAERRTMFSKDETLRREPLIKKEGLKGGGYYVEYRTDDARLTIEVMKAAVEKGATALNYAKVENLLYENGRIVGVIVNDQLSGNKYEVYAKKIINATGPWVDNIREKDGSKKGKSLILSKGVHIVIDQSRFPLKQAVYFDTPDKRMVFAIPRNGKAYVGTTDTFYDEDKANPKMTQADMNYLINAINYMFPEVKAKPEDVESSWAGIRPLIHEEGKGPSEISRKDEIWESDSGLITIAGGKLTGYRKMAETIVDLVAGKLESSEGRKLNSSQTMHLPISGGDFGGSEKFPQFIEAVAQQGVKAGLSKEDAKHIASFYGSNAPIVFGLINERKEEAEKFNLPLITFAKLAYGIQHELIATLVDFYFRRTGDLLFDIDSVYKTRKGVSNYMAELFSWSEAEKARFEAELDQEINKATIPVE
ncbi:glycerol-3-phosphate dehydrogenase/oxidase [Mesobacillus subterraneus]|uniref:glycerol-3-phosphate dehydrogenase/oxidase n=1 Tax=Mesobacillus subterraneus TaxID=285983 RepID=UPI00203FFF04|nr:glycerol-3-phosphate dehydrogenase/oxidase [Mesobacillus subterraneus]MCM3574148.1 glycerol-3-phosphate dehydrogenase/oxidase [Mesobacillus subterraneus]